MLAQDIEAAKRRVQIEEWDRGEAAVAETITDLNVAPTLTAEDEQLLTPWLVWCREKNVRHCPAKPHCVAAFVLEQHKFGISEEKLLAILAAIQKVHDKWKLSSPVQTAVVNHAVASVADIRPPRWPKADQAAWALLPAQVRLAIATREQQRDKELRRMQNEHAEMKRKSDAAQPLETEKVSN